MTRRFDLVIVGAGITGLSTALFYARRHPDKRVCVLERGFYPAGASLRNAGFASFGSPSELVEDLRHDEEAGVIDLLRQRYEGLLLLQNELGPSAMDYRQCGGYEIFTDEGNWQACLGELDRFNAWLNDVTGEQQVYKPVTRNGYNAIENRLEGYLHPGKMMRALLAKVLSTGVEVRFNTAVQRIQESTVRLQSGIEVEGKQLLLATNGFTSEFLPQAGIQPARGYVMVTGPLPGHSWKRTYHYDKGYVYFRDLGERLLIGGARNQDLTTETTTREGVNETVKQSLVSFADQVLQLSENWRIDYEWSGIMGFGRSKTPLVKQHNDRMFVAAGLGGMGVALGMKVGQKTVTLLSGQE